MSNTKNPEGKSLATKLAEILGEIGAMKREGWNDFHKYNYFTEDQITSALRQKFAQHKIVIIPQTPTVTSAREVTTNKGKIETVTTILTPYLICDGETGEQIPGGSIGEGQDPADKGAYKALTGAFKYFLQKMMLVSDQNDPEADVNTDITHAPEKHRSTRKYEEEPAKGKPASEADLATIRKFLETEAITEDFVMEGLVKAKLAEEGNTLDDLKPGVLTKVLTLRERIKSRWALANDGVDTEKKMEGKGKHTHKKTVARKTAEPDDTDQRTERQPIQTSITSEEFLEQEGVTWREVEIHFGTKKGTKLGDMDTEDVLWWADNVKLKPFKGKFKPADFLLDAALCVAQGELRGE